MGNASHKLLKLRRKKNPDKAPRGRRERPSLLPPDILTEEEVQDIQLTWPHLRPLVNDILTESFLELFRVNPDIKDKFLSFKDYTIEDLQKKEEKGTGDNALQRHVPRVGRAIVKAINHVANLDDVLDYLECVGKIHHKNGIIAQELSMLGPFFASAAVHHLPAKFKFTKNLEDIKDSWERVFAVLSDLMLRGYPGIEMQLTDEEKAIVKRTFALLHDKLCDVGTATFIGVFQQYSTSKMFFPVFKDSPLEDLTLNEALQNHGLRVMRKTLEEKEYPNKRKEPWVHCIQYGTWQRCPDNWDADDWVTDDWELGQVEGLLSVLVVQAPQMSALVSLTLNGVIERVIANLDNDPREIDIFLGALGQTHQTMGIEKKYLDVMGPIFCQAVRPSLQEEGEWSLEVRHAWLHLFRIIVIKIKRGYRDLDKRGGMCLEAEEIVASASDVPVQRQQQPEHGQGDGEIEELHGQEGTEEDEEDEGYQHTDFDEVFAQANGRMAQQQLLQQQQ